jgi:hypothetical protein
MPAGMSLQSVQACITAAHPELKDAAFTLLTQGWDSVAVEVDGRWIFRFPRHANAERALVREASLIAALRPHVSLTVPELTLHAGPPPFSRHAKIPGEHLLAAEYARLPVRQRERLAAVLAQFFAELHALRADMMAAAGALPIHVWHEPDEILRRIRPVLPDALRPFADRTIAAWVALPPDPHGTTYGFFDGHGWNMAFDHAAGNLNGIYDFADSGFGPLHQELIYPNWIARDLTHRIITEYETLTARPLDRRRVDVLSGVLRLSELAQFSEDPERVAASVRIVADWAGQLES